MQKVLCNRHYVIIFALGLNWIRVSNALVYQINAESLVQRNTYLGGYSIWSNLVSDLGSCATLCIRIKMCVSFNFDLSTGRCELNSKLLENHLHLGKSGENILYSRRQDWPPEVHILFHRWWAAFVLGQGVIAPVIKGENLRRDHLCFKRK